MSSLDTIINLLDRWSVWRETREAAARVPELERRIAALEAKLGDTWPADVCKSCGQRALRLGYSTLEAQRWDCQSCRGAEFRRI